MNRQSNAISSPRALQEQCPIQIQRGSKGVMGCGVAAGIIVAARFIQGLALVVVVLKVAIRVTRVRAGRLNTDGTCIASLPRWPENNSTTSCRCRYVVAGYVDLAATR